MARRSYPRGGTAARVGLSVPWPTPTRRTLLARRGIPSSRAGQRQRGTPAYERAPPVAASGPRKGSRTQPSLRVERGRLSPERVDRGASTWQRHLHRTAATPVSGARAGSVHGTPTFGRQTWDTTLVVGTARQVLERTCRRAPWRPWGMPEDETSGPRSSRARRAAPSRSGCAARVATIASLSRKYQHRELHIRAKH